MSLGNNIKKPVNCKDKGRNAQVYNHPCFSEDAHHFYARMHLPVAPKCNIQCNFCSRKYDCLNESRPGVTSQILSPEEACEKVRFVLARVPALSVVGIAGPGDPLANEHLTFQTLDLISEHFPDLKLCLSTNGLMLPDLIGQLTTRNIKHITVTINAIDQDIAQNIYSWVHFKGVLYRGAEAAKLLIERQLMALELLADNEILCKVNSLLIPEINDHHLPTVSREINKRGAFLHNIIPLIPCEGTVFAEKNIKRPESSELLAVQQKCEGNVKLMRHCRQCRADAVGLLAKDQANVCNSPDGANEDIALSQKTYRKAQEEIEKKRQKWQKHREEFTFDFDTPSLRVAVATVGDGMVNQHFGHATEFSIYEINSSGISFLGARRVDNYCYGPSQCGENPKLLLEIVELLSDCQALLSTRIGDSPRSLFKAAGVECIEVYDSIDNALYKTAKDFSEGE